MIPILLCKKIGKFNLKINDIPNGLENFISFNINNKLRFIDSLQFLSSSLDSLAKNVGENLSQEFDNNVSDLDKKKDFILLKV